MGDALGIIGDALRYYVRYFGVDPGALEAVQALDALTRLEGRVLPELPDGWYLTSLSELTSQEPGIRGLWHAQIARLLPSITLWQGTGPTPRAAVLAALAREEAAG
jgi:hypothetical protein